MTIDRPRRGVGGRSCRPAASGAPRQKVFASLKHRDFGLFWGAAVLSNTGSVMQQVTVPFVVFALTKSTMWLGISAAVAFVPNVLVAPLGGALADRHSRRNVLLACQVVAMASALGLWVIWISGRATVWPILGTLLVGSVAGGINIASWQAFVPQLVPRQDLMNAVRLNSIQFNVARAAGPMFAGLTLAQLGAGAAFLGNALSFVPVIAALLVIRATPPARTGDRASMREEFLEGVAYISKQSSMLQCVLSSLVLATLAYAVIQLAPAVAKDQVHVGKAGYGILVSGYGVGSIVTAFVMASYAEHWRRSRTSLGGVAVAALGMCVLAASTHLWMGLVAFFAIGVAQTMGGITYTSTIQIQVDEQFRGRVLSIYLMFIQLGFPIGALVLGSLAATTGTRPLTLACGILLVGYLAFVIVAFGAMRALDRGPQAPAADPQPPPDALSSDPPGGLAAEPAM